MALHPDRAVVIVKRDLVAGAPITVTVADDTIALAVSLPDFLAAVVAELGNPTLILTQAQLLAKLTAAGDAVRLQMQHATASVM